MDGGEVRFNITANSQQADQAIQQIIQALQQVGSTAQQTANTVNNASNNANNNNNENLDKTKKNLDNTGQKAVDAGDKIADMLKKIVSALALAKAVDFLGDITQQCVQAYANYEQLVGGVETLFGDASDTVRENAANAFQTVGLSANKYMETVTGFSASLIASLDGDTEAAAEKADRAIRDMSDNSNKMGSDIQSLQNAYAGFAKQNYTMLDNLKLGYGGTKEEMERLLADAEAISGIHYDISSYADVIDAIGIIQDKMGITGTTAKEAATTISGSISSLKAAWQDLLVGIADPEQSVEKLTKQVTDAVATVERNVMPRLQEIFGNMGTTIAELADGVLPMIPQAITALLPSVVDGLGSILDAVISNGADLAAAIVGYLPDFIDSIGQIASGLVPTLMEAAEKISTAVAGNADEIVESLIDNVVNFLSNDFPGLTTAAVTQAKKIILALVHGIIDHAPELAQAAPEIIATLITELINLLPELVAMGDEIVNSIAEGIVNYDWGRAISALNNGLADILDTAQKNVQVALDEMFSGGSLYHGDINNVESTPFIQNMRQGTEALVDTVDECTAKWREAYAEGRTVIDGELYTPRETHHRDGGYDTMTSEMNDWAKSMQSQSEEWKKGGQAAADTVTETAETLDEALGKLEHEYKTHKKSEEQYLTEKKALLEKYRDEEDEDWWKYYDDTISKIEKLAEAEKKAQDKANKAAADAAKKEVDAAKKKAKEEEDALKKEVSDKFRDLETEAWEEGYDDQWLLDQKKAFIETLDHETDLYKKYHHDLLKEQDNYDKKAAEKAKKSADDRTKELEKLLKKVSDAETKMSDSLDQSYGSLFKSETTTDARTGSTITKKSLSIEDIEKQLAAKRQLPGKIAKLLDSNVPDDLIRELLKLDPVDALEYADKLLRDPVKMNHITAVFTEDAALSDQIAELMTDTSDEYKALGEEAGKLFGDGFLDALGPDWQEKLAGILGDESLKNGLLTMSPLMGMIGAALGQSASGNGVLDAINVVVKGTLTDEGGRVIANIVNDNNEKSTRSSGK